MVKLVNVRLSANPATGLVDKVNGINGQVNVSSGGKLFFIEEYSSAMTEKEILDAIVKGEEIPTGREHKCVRTKWLDENGNFVGMNPTFISTKALPIKGFIPLKGEFVSKVVAPYEITAKDGTVRTVHTYTTVVFEGENADTVFSNEGYSTLNEDGSVHTAARERAITPVPQQMTKEIA